MYRLNLWIFVEPVVSGDEIVDEKMETFINRS